MEKATNSKGNSEAKRKAKGRKPDAWRSRRGLTAGDPTSKALRPPGDAPSRPERWVATPRPRGGRAGVGTRGSRRGRRRAEWRERRRCGDGGRGVRPQHRPGKRGAPAPRGGPRSPWRPPQTCMATEAALRHQPAGRGQGRSPRHLRTGEPPARRPLPCIREVPRNNPHACVTAPGRPPAASNTPRGKEAKSSKPGFAGGWQVPPLRQGCSVI